MFRKSKFLLDKPLDQKVSSSQTFGFDRNKFPFVKRKFRARDWKVSCPICGIPRPSYYWPSKVCDSRNFPLIFPLFRNVLRTSQTECSALRNA